MGPLPFDPGRARGVRAGRWHIAFAHIPDPIERPGDGSVVGIDRGAAVSAASTGEPLHTPSLTPGEQVRLRRLQQRLARAKRGSNRRARTKLAIARLKARETDRRRDWVEKTTTDLARRFDTIRVDYKAAGRLERVPAACTSQRCCACGHVAPENRKSQAVFACMACNAGPCNADVNAARNIAAGRAVTAQGDLATGRSMNCEPQRALRGRRRARRPADTVRRMVAATGGLHRGADGYRAGDHLKRWTPVPLFLWVEARPSSVARTRT
jgi:putative transposase